mmetsp:Transcript_2522/g.4351  ORF Transcript_2522/g.4351 Transcript_2522/m.4351 type:complete len:187 (-) Transcript_2522:1376-1936(-)
MHITSGTSRILRCGNMFGTFMVGFWVGSITMPSPTCNTSSTRGTHEAFRAQWNGNRNASQVYYGNAHLDGMTHGNWFMGHFLAGDEVSPLRTSKEIELKFSDNPSGKVNGNVAVNQYGHSMGFLISGRHRYEFPSESVTLEKLGDYVIWGPGVEHTWVAESHSVVLSIRWPSIPGDQVRTSSFSTQ